MNSWIVRVELPSGITGEQRDLLAQIFLRTARALSFLGMEDWSVSLPSSVKVLGIEAEFHDLAEFRVTNAPFVLYFGKEKDGKIFRKLLASAVEGLRISSPRRQAKKDWMKEWRKHYRPVELRGGGERLWIIPAWQKAPSKARGALALKIYPGQAFGTGTHATTKLCLELFLGVSGSFPLRALKVWDFGAGTGILAIAAGKWAAREKRKLRLTATEIDPVAREQCRKNARINRVKMVCNGTARDGAGKFDLVFANVLAPVLLKEKKVLARSLAPGAHLILSGLLAKEVEDFLPKFLQGARGLELVEERRQGDWSALLLRWQS